jgi:hypothetical protein
MEAPGKGFSFAGTKNILADRIDSGFFPNKSGDPPKLAFSIHRGSVNMKNNLFGSFWNLIKFWPIVVAFFLICCMLKIPSLLIVGSKG